MKILKQETYDQLIAKSANYDAVVNGMVSAGANAEEVTPEAILAAMEPGESAAAAAGADDEVVEGLKQTITELTSERDELRQRAETAEQRIDELEKVPAAEPIGGKTPPAGNAGGKSSLDEVNASLNSTKDFASAVEKVRSIL